LLTNCTNVSQKLTLQQKIINNDIVHVVFLPVQVQLDVTVWFAQDQLKGDNITEVRLKFNKRLEDAIPAGED
jgi:hypothetical protein